jgi:hypothetical protein
MLDFLPSRKPFLPTNLSSAPLEAKKRKYILSYLFTPWSRVHLEKLIGSQLVKHFPAMYETPKLITAFTGVRHLSVS